MNFKLVHKRFTSALHLLTRIYPQILVDMFDKVDFFFSPLLIKDLQAYW